MPVFKARVLVSGEAEAPALRLQMDISFWGGIDPATGYVIDSRHPQFNECLKGRILVMNRSIGSSSGSSILLELLRQGCGPAGIVLGEADFIVTLGAVVAREMNFAQIPVFQLDAENLPDLDGLVTMTGSGEIRYQQPGNSSNSPSCGPIGN